MRIENEQFYNYLSGIEIELDYIDGAWIAFMNDWDGTDYSGIDSDPAIAVLYLRNTLYEDWKGRKE